MYQESNQTARMERFAKVDNGWKLLTIFSKKLHLRCFTDF